MFWSLFNLHSSIKYSPALLSNFNIWPMFNANIFYYKLQNKLIANIYILESYRINKIIFYNVKFSFVEIFSFVIKLVVFICYFAF